jgi:hypothetical protein
LAAGSGDEFGGDLTELAVAVLRLCPEQLEGFGCGELVAGDQYADGLIDDGAGVKRLFELCE